MPAAPQHILSNPSAHEDNVYRIPTAYESAVMARRIMHLSQLGELVTSFPLVSSSDNLNTLENRPADVAGTPISLMEYIADCEPESGNPTLLAINLATPYKNYHAGSNISLSLRWWPEQDTHFASSSGPSFFWSADEKIPTPHTPAAMPRFSLQGHLERIEGDAISKLKIAACFLSKHPDSALWQPGNDIHESEYVRFVPEELYWFGGFGDRSFIGWIPIEDWRSVTIEEVEACRLPGESDKKSWSESFSAWREWL